MTSPNQSGRAVALLQGKRFKSNANASVTAMNPPLAGSRLCEEPREDWNAILPVRPSLPRPPALGRTFFRGRGVGRGGGHFFILLNPYNLPIAIGALGRSALNFRKHE